jgi:hypothetical protein
MNTLATNHEKTAQYGQKEPLKIPPHSQKTGRFCSKLPCTGALHFYLAFIK